MLSAVAAVLFAVLATFYWRFALIYFTTRPKDSRFSLELTAIYFRRRSMSGSAKPTTGQSQSFAPGTEDIAERKEKDSGKKTMLHDPRSWVQVGLSDRESKKKMRKKTNRGRRSDVFRVVQ